MKRSHEIAGAKRHLSGWKRGRKDARDKHLKISWIKGLALPPRASLRGKPGLKIENQEEIGACTCHAGTTALEYIIRKSGIEVQLSRLFPYAKVRQLEGTPLTEDSGAEIRDVVKILATIGSPLETLWPYDLTKWSVEPPQALNLEAVKHRATEYLRCGTLRAIKASIADGYPVIGGFQVPANMMSEECSKTGNVQFVTTEGWEGGHCVLFTGYNDYTKTLEFMNSWSVQWGDGGLGTLPFEFVTKGYADDFWSLRRAITKVGEQK